MGLAQAAPHAGPDTQGEAEAGPHPGRPLARGLPAGPVPGHPREPGCAAGRRPWPRGVDLGERLSARYHGRRPLEVPNQAQAAPA